MTYGCWNREPPKEWLKVTRVDWLGRNIAHAYDVSYPCVWKDDGACQHDSAKDAKCSGCRWQRKEERDIPTGDGGLTNHPHRQAHPGA